MYFNEFCTGYIDENVDYFDMCTTDGLNFTELGAMMGMVGLNIGQIEFWLLIRVE